MFRRKEKIEKKTYDRGHLVPALKTSICTGEQVAGFKDLRTGKFQDVMLIASPDDLERFKAEYDVRELTKIY